MTEIKAFAFHLGLILASAPKVKAVCHFTIKHVSSKGIKHYFSVMSPQWRQQRIFKAVRFFLEGLMAELDNFRITIFFLPFLCRSEQRGHGRSSKCHQDHPPTWRSHKPSTWVELSIVLYFTRSVLLCGFCILHCYFPETDISLSRCRAKKC